MSTLAGSPAAGRGVLFLRGPITPLACDRFLRSLEVISSGRISVHIDSEGGHVLAGLKLWEALAVHPAHITVEVPGAANSIASVIAMAANEIVLHAGAEMAVHRIHVPGMDDVHIYGNGVAEQLEAFVGRSTDLIAGIYAQRSGCSVSQAREWMNSERRFSAQGALHAGLCDAVRVGSTVLRPNPGHAAMRTHSFRKRIPHA